MLLFNKEAMFHSSSVMEPARRVQRGRILPLILNADGDLMRPDTRRSRDMKSLECQMISQRSKVILVEVMLLLAQKMLHFKNGMCRK